MGAECKSATNLSEINNFSIVEQLFHSVFGHIYRLRSNVDKTQKGLKKIDCKDKKEARSYLKKIEFLKQCDTTISTLIQIYSYDVIQAGDKEQILQYFQQSSSFKVSQNNHQNETVLLLHFQYFQERYAFNKIIQNKKKQLNKAINKGKVTLTDIKLIKLCDYQSIDKLCSSKRQFVNLFYQQIQILRMIDRVLGAAYFLHHFDLSHSGIKPENIIVDDEGKFIFVDGQLFGKMKNYDQINQFVRYKFDQQGNKNCFNFEQKSILEYICPEYIELLQKGVVNPKLNSEKVDVFCIGLVSLTMCLLDVDLKLFQLNQHLKKIVFKHDDLNKYLEKVSQRYSLQFSLLLGKMLQINPKKRISLSQVIDQINPLLVKNFESIKKVQNPFKSKQSHRNILSNKQKSPVDYHTDNNNLIYNDSLIRKLMMMERQYQRVINNRIAFKNRVNDQKQIKNDEIQIFQKLASLKITKNLQFDFNQSKISNRINPEIKGGINKKLNENPAEQFKMDKSNMKQVQNLDKHEIGRKQLEQIFLRCYEKQKLARELYKE